MQGFAKFQAAWGLAGGREARRAIEQLSGP